MKRGAVLFVWDRIGDYHLARVKACEKVLNVPVYTANLGSGDALYQWENIKGENHTNLSDKSVEQKDLFNRFKQFKKLVKEKEIAVICIGYGHTEYILFLLYARLKGIRTVVFCESWYSRGYVKDYLKSLLLKLIGKAYLVSGKRAYEHFTKHYKIAPEKIAQGYSVVDNVHFESHRPFKERKNSILCVARYSEEKNLEMLINAFRSSSISTRYSLQLVGDGPDKTKLSRYTNNEGVVLKAWVSYKNLPSLYAETKIFILPSKFEPWGLVVNEAMAAGLPLLLSEECGCVPDLIQKGTNGETFSWSDEKSLSEILDRWNTYNDSQLEEMGNRSKSIVGGFTPEQWAEQIKKMIF